MTAYERDFGGKSSHAPTLREIAVVLFRQKKVFLTVFAAVVSLAVIYALTGNEYEAHMKVLVRRNRADPPVTSQEKAPVEFARQEITEEELNSEVELLRDSDVLRRVAAANGLAISGWTQFFHPWASREEQEERAVQRLTRRLRVEPVKKTNLIGISYAAGDAGQAARVLRSLGEIYLEKHREVHRTSGELKFFEQQAQESRRQLDVTQNRLLQFSLTTGVVEAGKQRDLTLTHWNDADASHRQTEIEIAETEHREKALQQQLAILPQRTTTVVRTADNPELQKAMKSGLLDLEMKRTSLLTKYEPGHPLLIEVEAQIAQAIAALDSEASAPLRDETTEPDPNHEWAKAELQKTEVELRGLRAKDAAMHLELTEYQQMARQFGQDSVTQDDLESSEKAAQESYLLYVKKREEARMGDAADEHGIVNAVIAETPVVPALPVWPAWLVLVSGCFGAGFMATAAAFAVDAADPAFRTPDEVLAYLDTPVLASLPARNRQSDTPWQQKRPSESVHRVWGGGA